MISKKVEVIPDPFERSAHDRFCFFCGKATDDPAVLWNGATGAIFLHEDCALNLCVGLMIDVRALRRRGEVEKVL